MASMTDFIDSINVPDSLNVYNEDYSWAEEYAEYYNGDSSNYVEPILESSGYQFFGEAAFYQEAHKGLIAGGILALVSGAFFMIMKLLNGGGSSSSGSTSSSSSSNKTNNRSNNNNRPPSGGSAGQPHAQPLQSEKLKAAEAELQRVKEEKHKAEEETRRTLQRMDQMQKENDAKLKAQNDAFNAKIKADQEAKAKAEKEKAAAFAAEEERKRKALLEESKRKAEEDKKAKDAAYVQPAELEAEENLVFNAKIIIDELNKLKKEGYINTPIHNRLALYHITNGLEKIEEITDFMTKLVREGHWEIFGSSETEKGFAETFHKKCRELHDIVKSIQAESASANSGDKNDETSIDQIISDLKDFDKLTKSIESKCKEGMNLCKAERKKLIDKKKDVSNVDKAYKILNGIIRDVNVVCKNIQNAFGKIYKSRYGKSYPFPLHISYIFDFTVRPDVEGPSALISTINQKYDGVKNDKLEKLYKSSIRGFVESAEKMFYATDGTKISDFDINNFTKDITLSTMKENINNLKKIAQDTNKSFKLLKSEDPNRAAGYEIIEGVVQQACEVFVGLFSINPKDLVGHKKDECKIPEFRKCLEFTREYLFKDGSKYKEIIEKLNHFKSSDKQKSDKQKTVDEFVNEMSAVSFNTFFDNLKREEDDIRKKLYIPVAPHSIQFHKQLQKEFAKYEDDKDQEDFAINVHSILEKYVYGSDTYMSNLEWQKIERMLDRIGYKSIEAKVGDNISLSKTYWARPIKAKNPGDKEPGTIKQIQQMARVMKINVDGKDVIMKLAGKCTYWE